MTLASVSLTPKDSLYIQGMVVLTFDSTLNLIQIGAGQCRDVNNKVDIFIGDSSEEGVDNVFVSTSFVGPGGIDIGPVKTPGLYAIYVIWDSTGRFPVAGLASVQTIPIIPSGYDSYRQVGFHGTDEFGIFGDATGNVGTSNDRYFIYYVSQTVVSTNTPSTSPLKVFMGDILPGYMNKTFLATFRLYYTPGALTTDFIMNMGPDGVIDIANLQSPGAELSVSDQIDSFCYNLNGQNYIWYNSSNANDSVGIYLDRFYYSV